MFFYEVQIRITEFIFVRELPFQKQQSGHDTQFLVETKQYLVEAECLPPPAPSAKASMYVFVPEFNPKPRKWSPSMTLNDETRTYED